MTLLALPLVLGFALIHLLIRRLRFLDALPRNDFADEQEAECYRNLRSG
jgi:hypothetical protein